MNAKPGEIWLADLGLAAKTRPVLIISRHDPEAPRTLLIYVPLTTQHRGSRYEVPVGLTSTVRRKRARHRGFGRTSVGTQAGATFK